MNRIALYSDDLLAATTSTPFREIVLELMKQRSEDHFILIFSKGSEDANWWQSFRKRIPEKISWEKHELPYSRWLGNLFTLLGSRHHPRASIDADIYIRFEVGTMGPTNRPLVGLVLDLSALSGARTSSLKWHGRILWRRRLYESAACADHLVCISNFTATDVARLMPEVAYKLRVIAIGIAEEWFAADNVEISSEACLSKNPYFIWYGHMTPRKNIANLLKGYALAVERSAGRHSFPDFLFVGSGQDEIMDRAQSLGISDKVKRLPPQPLRQLIALVTHARGLAFPSYYEGFGMPIIEAFARGVPVLTSNVTSMPEVAGGLAELCDPTKPSSIAEGLIRLAQPTQSNFEQVAARKRHARNFTAERAARHYSSLIDEVLRRAYHECQKRPKLA